MCVSACACACVCVCACVGVCVCVCVCVSLAIIVYVTDLLSVYDKPLTVLTKRTHYHYQPDYGAWKV